MTIDDLIIDPKFRDLIPKLTDAEYSQLEKNILEDGRVKEPIIVWNKIIVDGHHRYYILQKHPEIPYTIEEKEFENEHDALVWACENQLGRRNLSPQDASYLRGTQYSEMKLSRGGNGSNQFDKVQTGRAQTAENQQFAKGDTVDILAERHHVARDTIQKDEKYKQGVDIAEKVIPGMKETIMHGETKVPKGVIEKIPKATPDKQRKAVIAISEGNVQKAKDVLNGRQETLAKYGLNDTEEEIVYSIDDLNRELSVNFEKCITGLKTTIEAHKDILNDDNKEILSDELGRMFRTKIKEFMEEI